MSTISADVSAFAAEFRDSILARARGQHGGDDPSFCEEAFTDLFIQDLATTGAIVDGHTCHFERRIQNTNARVDGYFFDEDEDDRLDLFVAIYAGTSTPEMIPREQVTRAVKGAMRFYELATRGVHEQMEPSDEAYSMLQRVHELSSQIKEVRVFVLTDSLAKEFTGSKAVELRKGVELKVHVWDIDRLSRCVATGTTKEPIEVNFIADFGQSIPCLPVEHDGFQYRSYLAVVPGLVLFRLYEDYGERLLELNVRSFLQARGKINKNIRKAILDEPQRFFAYNNGLTAVADEVRLEPMPGGGVGIVYVRGLQIVNGGQTTASIHRAGKKDNALEQLRNVSLQAKLSVIQADVVDEMVPKLSLYANSQNKVSEADFSANDPFHQQLEHLSRNVWTPDGLSHWFYERARGQYQVARTRDGRTPAAIKKFDALNPLSQMFSKTDLATSEHAWEQLPHLVSRGSQKNFREFTIRLGNLPASPAVDDEYFKALVARAMIFRHVQLAAREQKIGAYRANIIAFTVSFIASRIAPRVDLRPIWDRQRVPDAMDATIRKLLAPVGALIVQSAGTKNVTEWCKKEECWKTVRSAELLPEDEMLEGMPLRSRPAAGPAKTSLAHVALRARGAGLEVIDKTPSGGSLWIIGDAGIASKLDELEIPATYLADGGRSTGGRPAWYLK